MIENKPIIVQKYGGSSVATTEAIRQVAKLIAERQRSGFRLCIVVSAMGKTTDQLLSQAKEICANPSRRELDMLLTCGERASMALLAMALEDVGVPSMSLTGSQSGIITDDVHSGAKIIEVRPTRVKEALLQGKVVIVAGFQGISTQKEITTLGRGGSDTTAVALAAALQAEACEIYSDVAGVFSADPRIVPDAHKLDQISFEEMEELASAGAKVLNAQAVQFAKKQGIAIHAMRTGDDKDKTIISDQNIEALRSLTAIAHKEKLHGILLPDISALGTLLGILQKQGIAPMRIFGHGTSYICLIAREDTHGLDRLIQTLAPIGEYTAAFGSLSLVGKGLSDAPALLNKALHTLANLQIKVFGLSCSTMRADILLRSETVESAVKALHQTLIVEHSEP